MSHLEILGYPPQMLQIWPAHGFRQLDPVWTVMSSSPLLQEGPHSVLKDKQGYRDTWDQFSKVR